MWHRWNAQTHTYEVVCDNCKRSWERRTQSAVQKLIAYHQEIESRNARIIVH